MSEQREYNLDISTLDTYITDDKEIYEDIDFERYERSGVYKLELIWRNAYTYIDGDIAPGLFFEIECRRYPDFIYHSFKLQLLHNKHTNVIYQMEVYPEFKLSHRGKDGKVLYGTHIHHLKQTYKVDNMPYETNWYEWLKYFCEKANINISGKHNQPFIDELDLTR